MTEQTIQPEPSVFEISFCNTCTPLVIFNPMTMTQFLTNVHHEDGCPIYSQESFPLAFTPDEQEGN